MKLLNASHGLLRLRHAREKYIIYFDFRDVFTDASQIHSFLNQVLRLDKKIMEMHLRVTYGDASPNLFDQKGVRLFLLPHFS